MLNNWENKSLCIFCSKQIKFEDYVCERCLTVNAEKQGISKEECLKKIKEQTCQGCFLRVKWMNKFDYLIKRDNNQGELPTGEMLIELTEYWSKKTQTPIQWSSDGDWMKVLNSYIDKVDCSLCQDFLKEQKEDLENEKV